MPRRILSAKKIQQEVQKRVNEVREVNGTTAFVSVPHMQECDKEGCNWNIEYDGCPAGTERDIRNIVAQARQIYNLPDKHKRRSISASWRRP